MLKLLFFIILLSSNVYAGYVINPYTGKFDRCMTVKEEDGSPNNISCADLKVSNGTLIDNGDGSFSLSISGGAASGWTTDSSTKTTTTYNVGIGSVNPTTALDVSGTVKATAFQSQATTAGSVQLYEASVNGTNSVTYSAPSSISSDVSFTLPAVDGSSGQAIVTNGSGTLSFGSVSGSNYWALGSDNVSINTTYNIGLGSVNPTQKIDISGNVKATNLYVDTYGSSAQISNIQDSNTGIVFSGPDIMDLQTGGTSALLISSSQNIGIGTGSPNYKLKVSGSGSPSIGLQANTSSTTGSPALYVYNNTLGSGLAIGANNSATSVTYGLAAPYIDMFGANAFLGTSSANDLRLVTGATDRIRIASSGNIGIATVTPVALLDITSTAAQDLFRINDNGSGDTTPFIINSVGNVGIGTTVLDSLIATPGVLKVGIPASTSAPLRVLGGASGTDLITLERSSGATLTYGWSLAGGCLSFSDRTNSATTMGLCSDGGFEEMNFGVRNATVATTRADYIKGKSFGASAGTDVPGVDFNIQGSIGTGAGAAEDIDFLTANVGSTGTTQQTASERMTIKGNSGNVGIGSANPTTKLEVIGTVKATAFIGDGSGLTGIVGGSSQFTTINTNDVYLPNNGNIGLGTSLTTNAAFTVMNGNIGIGTWKPTAPITVGSGASAVTLTTSGLSFGSAGGGVSTGSSATSTFFTISSVNGSGITIRGRDTNAGSAGPVVVRGGQDGSTGNGNSQSLTLNGGDVTGNSAFNGGEAILRGGDVSGATGSGLAGDLTIRPGGATGSSAKSGVLKLSNTFKATAGDFGALNNIACFIGDNRVGDCPTSSTNPLGVGIGTTSPAIVQFGGVATQVPFDGTYSPSAGWYACTSATTAGKVLPQSTACGSGRQVGIITVGATSVGVGTFMVQIK